MKTTERKLHFVCEFEGVSVCVVCVCEWKKGSKE